MASDPIFHLIPLSLVWVWVTLRRNSIDPNLLNFIGLMTWRYSRLLINIWFYLRYQPAGIPRERSVHPGDVTIILPTVFDSKTYASDLSECIQSCLLTGPAEIIITTDTEENCEILQQVVTEIRNRLQTDGSCEKCNIPIRIVNCAVSSKRKQVATGIRLATTSLMVFVDDHVFLKPRFLDATVCAFEDPEVGLCGTTKTVRRQVPKTGWPGGWYWESFWNVMGALYLTRHNFEIRATNAADGGVFVVSGRALLVRTSIVKDERFLSQYLDERFLLGLLGPIAPDDDNFLTRWVTKHGWNIKIQDTDEARIETTLGQPDKFLKQCLRWARSTYRSNTCSLFTDRTVWRRQPWTVWTTFIPSLSNLAVFWDAGIVYSFMKSKLYLESNSSSKLLLGLCLWIYFAKSIKLMGYFRHHPRDFFLFFFPIPAYHLFAWCHSFIKLYAAATFYKTNWAGRKLNNPTLPDARQNTAWSKFGTSPPDAGQISCAFAFDVDGVLLKGGTPIPGARETIEMLQRWQIPFILLTNGGGMTEEAHVALISKRLGVSLSADQFVQSHSPYRDLVDEYRDQNILVIGGAKDNCRKVAESYGFRKVFTSSDYLLSDNDVHPFPEMTGPKHMEIAKESRAEPLRKKARMAAVFIWASPRDWCLDQQLLVDVLRPRDDDGGDQPRLYACNPDLQWATSYEEPRLAQGAFVSGLRGIWKDLNQGQEELEYVQFGKPTQATFEYGERALQGYKDRLNGQNKTNNQIKTVFMIGDNPESDIKGCNGYRSPFHTVWKSVLVETGVYKAGTVPAHTPTCFARSCRDAVQWALQQEGHIPT
ncbi:HAD-like domain-containing protein [Nemania sp. NC0429]|nr:HAD-like domain-containing protein [Nemania sp. NC0429]